MAASGSDMLLSFKKTERHAVQFDIISRLLKKLFKCCNFYPNNFQFCAVQKNNLTHFSPVSHFYTP